MLNLKNTLDGYLKNVEVIGNTIQDTNNLADIRSVGDKVEGQELYKIDVVSCGKNLFNKDTITHNKTINATTGIETASNEYHISNFIKINPNTRYIRSLGVGIYYYDKDFNFISMIDQTKNSPLNAMYCKLQLVNTWDLNTFQLEEGTQPTPYEPYQEDKLEILSPVQLEKVGGVADRIICKDGVWGVEKNIKTDLLKGGNNEDFRLNKVLDKGGYQFIWFANVGAIANKNSEVISSTMNSYVSSNEEYSSNIWIYNGITYVIHHPTISTSDELKLWLQTNPTIVKFVLNTPQFIPLPHDQQVKLRTFAGQTNIAFLTEIPGQIKAQVPKSLGATVNTHTEQIADLHNSLDRVKKLEETTVSTVETESNFTTVDATSNGYFEDVKLEGKTLVNLLGDNGYIESVTNGIYYTPLIDESVFKNGTQYTLILLNTNEKIKKVYMGNGSNTTLVKLQPTNNTGIYKFIYNYEVPNNKCHIYVYTTNDNLLTDGEKVNINFMVLEGDHTNNPPEFFEGLMSVGQDVEEVSVESVDGDGNLFNIYDMSEKSIEDQNTIRYRSHDAVIIKGKKTAGVEAVTYPGSQDLPSVYMVAGQTYYVSYDADAPSGSIPGEDTVEMYWCLDGKYVTYFSVLGSKIFTCNKTGYYYPRFDVNKGDATHKFWNIQVIRSSVAKPYTPYKSNKKPLLYYNPTTETWEKPILREWDSIEKHSDGKYYYHKRSGEIVLNGSESWVADSTAVHTTVNRYFVPFPKAQGLSRLFCDNFTILDTTNINVEGVLIGSDKSIYCNIAKSKLSTQDVAGFKAWLKANPTTVVYQLAQEEVYECTNIDLMTYSGETNYIINSGAISPKSSLKVHNNIANVVKILQEKVNLLENKFIAGLKSVLSGDMYSLATILYPEDFEQNDNIEQDIMVIPE